jgi:hypothetical protein
VAALGGIAGFGSLMGGAFINQQCLLAGEPTPSGGGVGGPAPSADGQAGGTMIARQDRGGSPAAAV